MAQTLRSYKPIGQWNKRESKIVDGYVLIKVPEHPRAFRGGWYYEHRLVAENQLGRLLQTYETCHHLNEVTFDNSPENIFVCTRKEHDSAHRLTSVYA